MSRESILAAEFTNDPLNIGYSTMTDAQRLSSITTKNISAKVPISARSVKRYLILNDKWLTIKNSTDANALIALDALKEFDEFDVQDSLVLNKLTSIIDGLITAGLVTTTDKTNVLAMGDTMISRAEQLGVSNPTLAEVARARNI